MQYLLKLHTTVAITIVGIAGTMVIATTGTPDTVTTGIPDTVTTDIAGIGTGADKSLNSTHTTSVRCLNLADVQMDNKIN
ncbi:hypothetical protein TUM19329_27270 [Legionella antarctica]|uniref:Uncharacterized protein n=1 Tax=Legionella antarctica TaxID=2708020 RepID=A0A6F8T8R1_9GAMM|nr:hypothetical protein TUM19329_27270 [Legionella antarctica]